MSLRPVFQVGRIEVGRARAVEDEACVAGGGAVGNHSYWQIGGVAWGVEHLHIEDSGEAAETLCPDTEAIYLVIQLNAEFFGGGFGASRD